MNDNQNPNVNDNTNSGVVNPSVNQSAVQTNVSTTSVPTATNTVPVQGAPVAPVAQSSSSPVMPGTVSPIPTQPTQTVVAAPMPSPAAPVQGAPVAPVAQSSSSPVMPGTASPIPTQPTQTVVAAPMPSPAAPVQATPVQGAQEATTPFFTPTSVHPDVQKSPELPPLSVPEAPSQEEVSHEESPIDNANGVEVIQTAPKGKSSNVGIIVFLIILIIFVFNIDTIISIYDSYKNPTNGTSSTTKNTNNVIDGYILIDENTSSIKVKDIKFYNFRKTVGKGVTFSYEVLAKYNNAKSLGIYVELYNSEREILYKELFNPDKKLEKDTVSTYVIHVNGDIYNGAFYALVKTYSDIEKKSTSSLTCTLSDKNYTYKHVYNFINNGLASYDIEKTSNKENDEKLASEYEGLKETNNATLENNTLKYTVDLNVDNGSLALLFEKNTTPKIIKDSLSLKEWKCE